MKVLLVNDYATPTAGAEIMTLTLRDALGARGHDARVFASSAQLVPGSSFADATCFRTNSRFQAVTSTFNLSARRVLASTIEEFDPDVVHVRMFLWQLSPSILSALRSNPAIYHICTYKPICPNGRKTLPSGRNCANSPGLVCLLGGCLTPQSWVAMMAQHWLWRRSQGAFDRHVTISKAMQGRLVAEGIGPCEVIPDACPMRPARPALAGDPIIAYAGRLSSEKGVNVLLRAFALMQSRIRNAKLWIAGDGPEAISLKELARQLRINGCVDFLGPLDRGGLERRFDEAWVQVVPSIWHEPFGIVAIEAMMRGTAVVASSCGGLLDSVRHNETGVLVQPSDEQDLAAAMERLASDRELCESMGAAGRTVAMKEYSIDVHCERMLAAYEQIRNKGTSRTHRQPS
ncbi:MAG: glycosyltransferase family 4 protein [Planctomycetota bacterium]|nr:glycosyltransferase family 4 protein [Planctomycetota bacterium]